MNKEQKQLKKFRDQLHNLLIEYPEIRLSAGLDGDIYALIAPNKPHALTEVIYLPTSGKQELINK